MRQPKVTRNPYYTGEDLTATDPKNGSFPFSTNGRIKNQDSGPVRKDRDPRNKNKYFFFYNPGVKPD